MRFNGWVDPVDEGGLGLDLATAAEMVGHDDDGGYLIATPSTRSWAIPAHGARWTSTSNAKPRLATCVGDLAPAKGA